MRSPDKPKIDRPITGADRGLIVEEIVVNLRPFKRDEAFATIQATCRIELLGRIKKPVRRPFELQKAYLHFRKSLTALIAAFERLPPSAIQSLVHLAGIHETVRRVPVLRPKSSKNDEGEIHIEYIDTGDTRPEWEAGRPILLQQLKRLAATAAGLTHGSSQGFSPDFSMKQIAAHHAYELMCEASGAQITGTAEAPYRNIARLMFEAVSGEFVDLKHWCDAEMKRRQELEELLRFHNSVGTDISRS
jgi:hypothetical protein